MYTHISGRRFFQTKLMSKSKCTSKLYTFCMLALVWVEKCNVIRLHTIKFLIKREALGFVLFLGCTVTQLKNNWRASCKKGVYRILADFHFFAGSSWFLADWLVLTWKASFRNFFCRLALRSPEIMFAKKLSFLLETFCSTKNKRNLLFR